MDEILGMDTKYGNKFCLIDVQTKLLELRGKNFFSLIAAAFKKLIRVN